MVAFPLPSAGPLCPNFYGMKYLLFDQHPPFMGILYWGEGCLYL